MPVTVVLTSLATVAMDTFITDVSSVIRNCAEASVISTALPAAGAAWAAGAAVVDWADISADGIAPGFRPGYRARPAAGGRGSRASARRSAAATAAAPRTRCGRWPGTAARRRRAHGRCG